MSQNKFGWIRLHRTLLDWEWYDDINTCRLFIHILLKVNHSDKKYRGIVVKRGTVITSREILALETSLSQRQIRTALNKLKTTNELSIESSRQGTIIQVINYEKYQDVTNETTNELSAERPTSDQRATSNNNDNKEKNDNKESKRVPSWFEFDEVKHLNKETFVLFETWMKYKAEIKDSYKSETSIIQLAKKFNSEPLPKLAFVVNNSIQNGWKGLFWDKYVPEQNAPEPLPKEIKPNVSF